MLRQAAQKQQRAINDYNREVRQRNSRIRRAVDTYNREVRAHNARVAENRRILRAAMQRLSTGQVVVKSTYYRSVAALHQSYEAVEQSAPGSWLESRDDLLDLAQGETANSLALADIAEGGQVAATTHSERDSQVETRLAEFSADLASRWRGALFSLNPSNPDAARHFSASSREILAQIIEGEAPDEAVLASNPAAPLIDGRPTRRARLAYCLVRSGRASDALAAFADADVEEVVELFKVFNDGTHGPAGVFDASHLHLIRSRVEGAVTFLHSILRT